MTRLEVQIEALTVIQAKRPISEPIGSAILNGKCMDSKSQLFVLEKDDVTNKFSG